MRESGPVKVRIRGIRGKPVKFLFSHYLSNPTELECFHKGEYSNRDMAKNTTSVVLNQGH